MVKMTAIRKFIKTFINIFNLKDMTMSDQMKNLYQEEIVGRMRMVTWLHIGPLSFSFMFVDSLLALFLIYLIYLPYTVVMDLLFDC